LQQINNGSLTCIRQTWRAAEDRGHHDYDDTMRHAPVASNTASNAQISRILAFAASSHIAAQQKGEIPPQKKSRPNVHKFETFMLSKLLHLLESNITQRYNTSTTKYSSCVVEICTQQIQNGGRRPYWKNRKIAESPYHFS